MDAQDLLTASDIRSVHRDAAVEAAGAQQRRVEDVGAVRRRDEDDGGVVVEAVHLDEELVQGLLALVVAAAEAGAALAADRVDLVDEDDARRRLLGLLEQVADARGADADEHLDEVGARDGEERHARLAGDGLGQQRLAGTRRTDEQQAVRDLGAHAQVALGLGEEVADLLELLDGLLDAGDVVELDLRALLRGRLGLRLAELHRAAVLVADAAHVEDEDADEQAGRHDRDEDRLEQRAVGGVDGELDVGMRRHELLQRVGADVVGLIADKVVLVLAGAGAPVVAARGAVGGLVGHVAHATVVDRRDELVRGDGVDLRLRGEGVGARGEDEVHGDGEQDGEHRSVGPLAVGALGERELIEARYLGLVWL